MGIKQRFGCDYIIAGFLLVMLCFILPHEAKAEASSYGRRITSLKAEGLSRIERSELFDLIGLKVGDVLTRKELKYGMKRAFKKNMFLDIAVVSIPAEEGIGLKYIVKEIPLINKVNVSGNVRVKARYIREAFLFKEGKDYKDDLLGKAYAALISFYERKGFPQADVTITIGSTNRASSINLNIHVREGKPHVIEKIVVPEDAKRYLRVIEGGLFDRDILDNDMVRIRNYYKSLNYINPVVGPYSLKNDVLVVPVHTGPKLKLIFKGSETFLDKLLIKEIAILDEDELTDEIVEESVNQLRRFYMSRGFINAEVAAGVEITEDVVSLTYYVFEGKKVLIGKIDFKGTSVADATIKDILPLKEGSSFNETLLGTAEEGIEQLYNALGYLNVNVVDIKRELQSDGTVLDLEFIIHEGSQTRIDDIVVEGNSYLSVDMIMDEIRIRDGGPYNVIDIGDARYRVLALYGKYGYVDAVVDVESRIDGEKAFVRFKIKENSPSVIGKVIIRGNYKTKTRVISREFRLFEGAPYNYDEVLRIRQRLYKLGIFNEVSIEMLDSDRKRGDKKIKDVLVTVKEGNPGAVEIGLGYSDYEEFRSSFDISYSNVDGYARRLGLRAELSGVEERYILNYKEPRFLNMQDIPLSVFIMKEDMRSINLDTNEVNYRIDRLSLLFNTEKELLKGLKGNLNYEYSIVETSDVAEDVILSKEDTGTLGIGSVSPSLFYDTRDNPFNPTSGALYGIVLKFASELFFSETEFMKGVFQGAWFTKLSKRTVFALALKTGAAKSFDENEEIPLVERFFLGGRTTVRGYSHDSLGPKGSDDTPTGGNLFFQGNAEVRTNVGRGFGIVLFLDSGNVWQTAEDSKSEIKYTTGAGVRYNTPVGPVRLDYGHKLDREDGESKGEVHFSFGHAF